MNQGRFKKHSPKSKGAAGTAEPEPRLWASFAVQSPGRLCSSLGLWWGGREINGLIENLCKETVGGGNSVFWLALPLLHSLP